MAADNHKKLFRYIGMGIALAVLLGFAIFTRPSEPIQLPPADELYIAKVSVTNDALFKSFMQVDNPPENSVLGYLKTDLNQDEREDFIVRSEDSLYCGSRGCLHGVIVKMNGRWVVTNRFFTHYLAPISTQTGGFYDLMVDDIRWVWNPAQKKYQSTWNPNK